MSVAVYLIHPVAAPSLELVAANIARAKRWGGWLLKTRPEDVIVASWLLYVETLVDDLPNRRRGIRDSCRMIRSGFIREIAITGGKITPGMEEELDVAAACRLKVTSYLHLGEEPPEVIL